MDAAQEIQNGLRQFGWQAVTENADYFGGTVRVGQDNPKDFLAQILVQLKWQEEGDVLVTLQSNRSEKEFRIVAKKLEEALGAASTQT